MKIGNFVLGPVGTNCYIAANDRTKECVIIDPGACPADFIKHIKNTGLSVKAVLLTHGHFDHIMGLDGIRKEFAVPVYAFREERKLLEDAALNASATMYGQAFTFSDAEYVCDDQELSIAGMKIHVIHTPGHTLGGCCYYFSPEKVLFSGDTLFRESVGRTDLPTGSTSQLVRSVREKLFVLPDDTRVYPGHMEETTIGYEKRHNPFL